MSSSSTTSSCMWFKSPCSLRSDLLLSYCGPYWPGAVIKAILTMMTINITGPLSHQISLSISASTAAALQRITCSKKLTCKDLCKLQDNKWMLRTRIWQLRRSLRKEFKRPFSRLLLCRTSWAIVQSAPKSSNLNRISKRSSYWNATRYTRCTKTVTSSGSQTKRKTTWRLFVQCAGQWLMKTSTSWWTTTTLPSRPKSS